MPPFKCRNCGYIWIKAFWIPWTRPRCPKCGSKNTRLSAGLLTGDVGWPKKIKL